MPKKKKKNNTVYELNQIKLIKAAELYKNGDGSNPGTGQYPERRKLAQLTGLSMSTVQQMVKRIQDETGRLYARNLTDQERGQRAGQSARGEEYEPY